MKATKFVSLVTGALIFAMASTAMAADVTLKVGFENSITEPIGQGLQKWAELLAERSGGTMELVLYPDSQLGSKSDLIDSMLLGENVCTLANGAFFADYGVPDFGITWAPFIFSSWDDCWKLIESDWYAEQCKKLEGKGLKILASNWAYGARHLLTVKPVTKVEDLSGMKIRVPNTPIQTTEMNDLGATAIGMALGDVYQALQTKTIDGLENPVATLYGTKHYEVAKYLILDAHVLDFTSWTCSKDWFDGLTAEQQKMLVETGREAGFYNSEVLLAAEAKFLQMLIDAGVKVIDPTPEVLDGFRAKAETFYKRGAQFNWSDGLYETVCAAMGK